MGIKQEQKEEKQIVSKPTISEDWMIDDVGTIESTDEEDCEVKVDISKTEKKEDAKTTEHITTTEPASVATKPTISEDWMIDDVGTIESSDEEESEVNVDEISLKQEHKEEKHIVSKPTISEDWMIDDVGTIESS